jgi:NAD dependent epimerase/dehydratase family enzyme
VGEQPVTGLLGARSLVGECVIPLLVDEGRQVFAFSRAASDRETQSSVTWLHLDALSPAHPPEIKDWLCVAPIWVLPQYFPMLEACGVHRVVALSSTSLFTKTDSSDSGENAIAARLADGEARLRAWAESKGVEWVILRPTLIYGQGRDKNIVEIARFIRRFGFFPLLGKAMGLRQPVHAADVAGACLAALKSPLAANRAYNISGAETLSYRDMVSRVFAVLQKRPRLVTIPLVIFRMAVACARLLPRYRHWSAAMAERMNQDLVFDHAEASRDLGYSPRPFLLAPEDVVPGIHPAGDNVRL